MQKTGEAIVKLSELEKCQYANSQHLVVCPVCAGTKTSIIEMVCTFCCADGKLSDVGFVMLKNKRFNLEKLGITF